METYKFISKDRYDIVLQDLSFKEIDELILEDLLIKCQQQKIKPEITNDFEAIPLDALVITKDGLDLR